MGVNIRISTSGGSAKGKRNENRRLGLAGEDARGVLYADEFLLKTGRYASYRLNSETLVVGGTDEAFEAALHSAHLGSQKTTVVCPELASEMRANADLIAEAERKGIKVIHGWGLLRISIHTDERVSGAFFKHCERAFDDEGRFSPIFDEKNVMAQYCDNLVLATG